MFAVELSKTSFSRASLRLCEALSSVEPIECCAWGADTRAPVQDGHSVASRYCWPHAAGTASDEEGNATSVFLKVSGYARNAPFDVTRY